MSGPEILLLVGSAFLVAAVLTLIPGLLMGAEWEDMIKLFFACLAFFGVCAFVMWVSVVVST